MSKDNINEILDDIFGDDEKMKSEIRKVRERNAEIGDKNTIVPQIEMPLSDMHIGAFKYGVPGIGKGRTTEAIMEAIGTSYDIADSLLEDTKEKNTN